MSKVLRNDKIGTRQKTPPQSVSKMIKRVCYQMENRRTSRKTQNVWESIDGLNRFSRSFWWFKRASLSESDRDENQYQILIWLRADGSGDVTSCHVWCPRFSEQSWCESEIHARPTVTPNDLIRSAWSLLNHTCIQQHNSKLFRYERYKENTFWEPLTTRRILLGLFKGCENQRSSNNERTPPK